jgi:hypothetical protein
MHTAFPSPDTGDTGGTRGVRPEGSVSLNGLRKNLKENVEDMLCLGVRDVRGVRGVRGVDGDEGTFEESESDDRGQARTDPHDEVDPLLPDTEADRDRSEAREGSIAGDG